MAPRANWKGFLRLSLVTCPVALYSATSEADKISFNQINKNTGHRILCARARIEIAAVLVKTRAWTEQLTR